MTLPVRPLAIFIAGLALLSTQGCESLSRMLKVPISAIERPFELTPEDEIEIGRQFAREARRSQVRSTEVSAYVQEIGQKILASLGAQPFLYHFAVIRDPQLNAFAVPGGYVYVNSGLIERADSPDELASVLGHEVAHIKAHHIARQMRKARLLSGLSLAAILLSRGDQAATVLSQAGQQQLLMNYGRDLEREADQLGLVYMQKAGFQPRAMVSFFQKVLQEQRFNAANVPPYLLMHPLTQERIGSVEDLMRVLKVGQDGRASGSDRMLGRIQALIKAETLRPDDAVGEYARRLEQEPNRAEWHYYLGIVYLQLGQYEKARTAYETARGLQPDDASLHTDLGITYLKLGLIRQAQASLARALELNPQDPRSHHALGKVALAEQSWNEAISHNQTAVRIAPRMGEAYLDIGAAYSGMSDAKEAYYFLGVGYRVMEEKERALHSFEKALPLFGKDSSRGRMILKEMVEIKETL